MARMIPQLSADEIDSIESKAEAKLYSTFKDRVPPAFDVYYSACWILKQEDSGARDGEIDFIVCHPDYGFLAIEVKGGGISFNADSSEWYSVDARDQKHKIKNPIHQAVNAKFAILSKLKEHPKWYQYTTGPILCGHALFFPDVSQPTKLIRPDLPSEIVGSRSNLESPTEWLMSVFDYWRGESDQNAPLSRQGAMIFKEIFGRSFEVRPLLSQILIEEEERRIVLTEEQARILDILRAQRRATISGGAGTGKSLLAVEKAKRLAQEGFTTLLTCYNEALAEHLGDVCQGIDSLHVMNYHKLCSLFIRKADLKSTRNVLEEAKETYPNKDYWDVLQPAALSYALDIVEDRYDAIVCDEGQDFGEDFWLPIELLLTDYSKSPLYIFFDENQNIYSKVSSFPIEEALYYLTINCRNTEKIHYAAYNYYRGDTVSPSQELKGQEIKILDSDSVTRQAQKIHSEIINLLSIQRINHRDIVVLIANSLRKQDYFDELSKLPTLKSIGWQIGQSGTRRDDNAIFIDTCMRFKGLESAVVFLWGPDTIDLNDEEILYVGLSRAKSVLYLVGNKKYCENILST